MKETFEFLTKECDAYVKFDALPIGWFFEFSDMNRMIASRDKYGIVMASAKHIGLKIDDKRYFDVDANQCRVFEPHFGFTFTCALTVSLMVYFTYTEFDKVDNPTVISVTGRGNNTLTSMRSMSSGQVFIGVCNDQINGDLCLVINQYEFFDISSMRLYRIKDIEDMMVLPDSYNQIEKRWNELVYEYKDCDCSKARDVYVQIPASNVIGKPVDVVVEANEELYYKPKKYKTIISIEGRKEI